MSLTAGYSTTPLPKKLGLKPGLRAAFVGLPADLSFLLSAEPAASVESFAAGDAVPAPKDFVHAFFSESAALEAALPAYRDAIAPAGTIWVSWPKKAAKVATDLTEDVIRALAIAHGLVDVKVCAVSDVWSGLKLVIPLAARGAVR